MTKILIVSDSIDVPSGFAVVAKYVSHGLSEMGYDVSCMGYATLGFPKKINMLPEMYPKANVTMLPRGSTLFGDPDEFDRLGAVGMWVKKLNPDILISIADLWMTEFISGLDLGRTRWIRYLPLDTEILTSDQKENIISTDVPLAMSRFGKQMVKNYTGLDIPHIPHGVNVDIFKPIPVSEKLNYREKNKLSLDDFIILMVGRNQERKAQPYMMKAFAEFAKDKNDVKLLCHFDLKGNVPEARGCPPLGWDLNELGRRLGLISSDRTKNKIIRTMEREGFQVKFSKQEKDMPCLYQMSDVHYNSGNEGFGIPAMEANACGCPNVSPNYTTGPELTDNGNCGLLCKPDFVKIIVKNTAEWCIPEQKDLAEKFQMLYDDRELLQRLGEKAVKYARENYDWRKVIPMWDKLIQNVLATPKSLNYNTGDIGV